MTADELFKAGQLQAAIDAQIQDVKAHPADQNKRLFLFELACFSGDLDRARRQIDLIKYDDVDIDVAVQKYGSLLDAEQARRRFFASGQPPKQLAPLPDHINLRLEAMNLLRVNQSAEAMKLLEAADAAAPVLAGALNDKAFTGIRDGDDVFGPVLEVLAHAQYYWVPIEQIRTLAMNPPKFPRDVLWRPARLELEGTAGDVFLPTLYPGTHEQADEQLKLGRATDWVTAAGTPVRGLGARTFLVGDEGVDLLRWRELVIGTP